MGGMGWQTEDAGVSRLVERKFWRPRSTNGESDGRRGELRGNNVSVWDALVFVFLQMGRACLKFGESTNFAPLLNFGPTAGRG